MATPKHPSTCFKHPRCSPLLPRAARSLFACLADRSRCIEGDRALEQQRPKTQVKTSSAYMGVHIQLRETKQTITRPCHVGQVQ